MPDPRLQDAIEHHQAGRLPEAEDIYRAILDDDPKHPDVHRMLGDLPFRTRHFEDAARPLHAAVQMQPYQPHNPTHPIEALVSAGYEDDAAKVLEEAQQLGLITVNTGQ